MNREGVIMTTEKKLTRSSSDKMLCGVAAGVAEYFDIDPVLVRLAFVLLTLADGVGVLAYIALCIVMPEQTSSPAQAPIERDTAAETEFVPLGTNGH
jgi:phage shock protein C